MTKVFCLDEVGCEDDGRHRALLEQELSVVGYCSGTSSECFEAVLEASTDAPVVCHSVQADGVCLLMARRQLSAGEIAQWLAAFVLEQGGTDP